MPKLVVDPIYEFSGALVLHPAADIFQRGKRLFKVSINLDYRLLKKS
jgi:hypothetical protein